MLKYLLVFAAALLCSLSPAEARHRHHHYGHRHHYHLQIASTCDNMFCWFNAGPVAPPRVRPGTTYRQSRWAHARARQARQVASYTVTSGSWQVEVARPSRFIAGRLVCAVNVGVALAERGIRGTGSALALSYLHWGRSAGGPVPGAVIVSSRRGGGHVAIVSRVENGVVYAWNATGGQRGWREIPYRHSVIDYRVPG
jgi:hypothetical protein